MSLIDTVYPVNPELLDDEIMAWTVAIGEVDESAFDFYHEELEKHLAFIRDVKLAHSIAQAVESDTDEIIEASHDAIQTQGNLEPVARIGHDDPTLGKLPVAGPASVVASEKATDEEKLTCGYLAKSLEDDEYSSDSEPEAGPSIPHMQLQARALDERYQERYECVVCFQRFREKHIIKLPCRDQYCNECLKQHVLASITRGNLNLFPPSCHRRPISDEVIASILNEEELELLRRAEVEKATTRKTYCAAVDCGEFIEPEAIDDTKAYCTHCSAHTCIKCRSLFHAGDCIPDEEVTGVIQLSDQQNWRQCFSCNRVVEKMGFGCNHMT